MFDVYILKNRKNKYYIGQTGNLELRIKTHGNNEVFSTKNRGPWKLVYKKTFITRSQAMVCEKYLKSLKGGQGFKKIFKEE